jgi:hypothetical protein
LTLHPVFVTIEEIDNLESAHMDKKIKFFFGLLLLIVFALAGEIIYYNSLKNKPSSPKTEEVATQPTASPTPKKPPYLEIAKKALGCLEKMRDEEGLYVLGKRCTAKDNCKLSFRDNRIIMSVLWGRTKYFEKTKDKEELEKIRRDLDLYLDNQKVSLIRPAFWSKRLLYEMWQSSAFSPKIKRK